MTPAERVVPKPFKLEFTEFWWRAAAEGRLVIQQCSDCGQLRHPPSPTCPTCLSFSWGEKESFGLGTVHSFVVSHHPQHDAFEYPLVIALIDLDEGTRLVVSCDITRADIEIGLRVRVGWFTDSDGTTLPIIHCLEQGEGKS